jgi:hypothetical protein
MIDVPLLRKELQHITDHPEEWDQDIWIGRAPERSCGTVGCLAGNTVLHSGLIPLPGMGQEIDFDDFCDHVNIATMAAILLGLTRAQANFLFSGKNSLYDLWYYASVFTEGEIEVPLDVIEKGENS